MKLQTALEAKNDQSLDRLEREKLNTTHTKLTLTHGVTDQMTSWTAKAVGHATGNHKMKNENVNENMNENMNHMLWRTIRESDNFPM